MDKTYADTVRLLLAVAPDVFANAIFAMKGGTAINLFVRDMPRLSVDIDVVYTPLQPPREKALADITDELAAIGRRLTRLGLSVRTVARRETGDMALLINSNESQVKVEVNPVFRGTVLPVEPRALAAKTAAMFSTDLTLPVLAPDELYGGKIVAAMDRQHPRDLFDVLKMYAGGGLTDGAIECFVTYLAGHDRPIHEVLFAKARNIALEYDSAFAGMVAEPVSLDILVSVRDRLFEELPRRLTDKQRRLLIGLSRGDPDWSLLRCPHACDLPALKWKLLNLIEFQKRRPADFERQSEALAAKLR